MYAEEDILLTFILRYSKDLNTTIYHLKIIYTTD